MTEWDWILDDASMETVKKMNMVCGHLSQEFDSGADLSVPPVFIVGPPRSGTTLLYQLVSTHLDVAFINNFMARFWEAPAIGAYLSARVAALKPQDDVESEIGRTRGLGGVHEFGYFWKRFFHGPTDFADEIAPELGDELRREVAAMEGILGKRMVFKNLTCGLRINALATVFGKPLFVEMRRSPLANAMAILKARRLYHGEEETWWSLEPEDLQELKWLPVAKQINAQIAGVSRSIVKSIEQTRAEHMVVEYESLCEAPQATLEAVARRLGVSMTKPCETKLKPRFAPAPRTELERELHEFFGPDAR